jgi:hypothetical protein
LSKYAKICLKTGINNSMKFKDFFQTELDKSDYDDGEPDQPVDPADPDLTASAPAVQPQGSYTASGSASGLEDGQSVKKQGVDAWPPINSDPDPDFGMGTKHGSVLSKINPGGEFFK